MTAAEKLRRASEVVRAMAEAATPGPWHVDRFGQPDKYGPGGWQIVGGLSGQGGAVVADRHARRSDATFIAAMNPTVALAVADWLEYQAAYADASAASLPTGALTKQAFVTAFQEANVPGFREATKIADAILAGVEG